MQITYKDVQLEIDYEDLGEEDFGVDGSPVWREIEINSVMVGGVDIYELLSDAQLDEIKEKVLENLE